MKRITTLLLLLAAQLYLWGPGDSDAQRSEYRVQPTDVLTITVHGHSDLTTKTRVTADGYISFPLLGKVVVKGLTVQETERTIKERLEERYLVNAEVLVFIEEYHPKQISVIGEVKNAGKYDMPAEKDLTLMQALAMAGGFTKHADIRNVRVIRIEDGKEMTVKVNVKEIVDKGEKERDVVLQPDDMVFVPESFF